MSAFRTIKTKPSCPQYREGYDGIDWDKSAALPLCENCGANPVLNAMSSICLTCLEALSNWMRESQFKGSRSDASESGSESESENLTARSERCQEQSREAREPQA